MRLFAFLELEAPNMGSALVSFRHVWTVSSRVGISLLHVLTSFLLHFMRLSIDVKNPRRFLTISYIRHISLTIINQYSPFVRGTPGFAGGSSYGKPLSPRPIWLCYLPLMTSTCDKSVTRILGRTKPPNSNHGRRMWAK